MIAEKLIMPYILASMHPLIHVACLILLIFHRLDILITQQSTNPELHNCIDFMIAVHAVCIIIESTIKAYMYKGLKDKEINPYKHASFNKFLMLIKLFLYFIAIMYV